MKSDSALQRHPVLHRRGQEFNHSHRLKARVGAGQTPATSAEQVDSAGYMPWQASRLLLHTNWHKAQGHKEDANDAKKPSKNPYMLSTTVSASQLENLSCCLPETQESKSPGSR